MLSLNDLLGRWGAPCYNGLRRQVRIGSRPMPDGNPSRRNPGPAQVGGQVFRAEMPVGFRSIRHLAHLMGLKVVEEV